MHTLYSSYAVDDDYRMILPEEGEKTYHHDMHFELSQLGQNREQVALRDFETKIQSSTQDDKIVDFSNVMLYLSNSEKLVTRLRFVRSSERLEGEFSKFRSRFIRILPILYYICLSNSNLSLSAITITIKFLKKEKKS